MISNKPPGTETPRRSAMLAVFLSGLFPGLGQLYNRRRAKAAAFALAAILTGFGPWSPLDVDIDLSNPQAGLSHALLASVPFLVVALWSLGDAYRDARR